MHTKEETQHPMEALRPGAVPPTGQMGRRVDLPDAMRAKMENAFGADLSAVKLYESRAVADAGARAVTQGGNIAFAPGMLDFTSYGGQALLGHEISHVVSQARGEVTGGGFLNDHALEARADREGAMAAAGQRIAAPTAALSSASSAPAAGPMQANKDARRRKQAEQYRQNEAAAYDRYVMANGEDEQAKEQHYAEYLRNRNLKAGRLKKLKMTPEQIEADHRGVTAPMAQVNRANERHLGPLRAAGTAPDRQTREEHYNAYLGNLGKIMGSLSDDELRAQPEFQKRMVTDYASAHRALYGPGGQWGQAFSDQESGSFLPGGGPDLLGTMYGRLMGSDSINAALTSGSVEDSIQGLNRRAKDSGVTDLMALQYSKLPGKPSRVFFDLDRDYSADPAAMRDLMSKAVSPMAGSDPKAGQRIGEIGQELDRLEAPAKAPAAPEPSSEELSLMHMQKALEILQAPIEVPPAPGMVEKAVRSAKDFVENGVDSIQRSFAGMRDEHEKNRQSRQEEKAAKLQRERGKLDFDTLRMLDQMYGLGAEPTEDRLRKVYKKLGRD